MRAPRPSTPGHLRPRLLAVLVALAGCGPAVTPPTDGGAADAGSADAGNTDAGNTDAGSADAGNTDAGNTDAGSADAGPDPCAEAFTPVASPGVTPPFSGTAFVTDDLIRATDPTSFVGLTYAGQGVRTMYDRRTASFNQENAHLFDARFGASKVVEIQVNPEMSQAEAEVEARFYATVIGRIPGFLFRDLETVWIHRGVELFGGGNNNFLIHTGQGAMYGDSIEEIFVHEGAHTSMDAYHASSARWLEAQSADGLAISDYARDNPTREDVSESLGPYLALRLRRSRISAQTAAQIMNAIPNRIRYFDCLGLSMDPLP